jgi:hypothetical protein
VREDYSPYGTAGDFFPHDHARFRAYRWGEDGLAGICDNHQRLCFALALWNGRDAILKERLFGLTGGEGNHGEDVKAYYFYLDATPTHSYMEYLYKYPQAAFPYSQLVEENRQRNRDWVHVNYEDVASKFFEHFVYTQAEHLYQVHGLHGADPTDPPASAPYLFPPLSHEPRIQALYDDLEKAGYHPSPAPTGILLNEQAPHRSPWATSR